MAFDRKYGRVTTEYGTHGEDEPVVVFRAQDRLLPDTLEVYRILCALAGSPAHHLAAIDDTIAVIKAWQVGNLSRTPNSNAYMNRIGTTS